MSCTKLKETLNNSIYKICSDIDSYVYNPGKDYSRVRKLPAENVISYLISQGGSSTKCEFLDFYMLSPETPTVSALNQRRSQLKPDAFKAVFHEFTNSYMESETVQYDSDYQYIATDGSTISFSSLPRFASDEYYISEGHSASGFYSMHINAWGIETSFRKLKYTIGLSFYHSYKPDFIKQEIWAKLIAYNATEFMINTTIYSQGNCKYTYAINFSVAAHICRIYLRLLTEVESIDVMALLKKELIPVRPGRQFPRLKTAHFRKPKCRVTIDVTP